jgi:hypothetical protein
MKRLKQLEEENGKLKRIVADLAPDKDMLYGLPRLCKLRGRSDDDSLLKCSSWNLI